MRESLGRVPEDTGLDLDDVYGGNHSWTEMRRAAGLPTGPAGPEDGSTAGGRSPDPRRRRGAHRRVPVVRAVADAGPSLESTTGTVRCWWLADDARYQGVVGTQSISSGRTRRCWRRSRAARRARHGGALNPSSGRASRPIIVPRPLHASRPSAGFGVGEGASPPLAVRGLRLRARKSDADLFAFTSRQERRGFSPTTLTATTPSVGTSSTGRASRRPPPTAHRAALHQPRGGRFERGPLRPAPYDDRAFWCLGTARYAEPRRRPPHRVRLEARPAAACRPLHVRRRRSVAPE